MVSDEYELPPVNDAAAVISANLIETLTGTCSESRILLEVDAAML